MKVKYQKFKRISLIFAVSLMLQACKPPSSGESTSWQYPLLQFQLARQNLSQQLPMPVEGITPKQISNTWGAARGQGRKHEGIDIFAKRGTAVLSTTQGIVAKVGLDSLGGSGLGHWSRFKPTLLCAFRYLCAADRCWRLGRARNRARLCRKHGECEKYTPAFALWDLSIWARGGEPLCFFES